MHLEKHHGSVIWTNHALARLEARRIPQEVAYKVFMNPDSYQKGKNPETWQYTKQHLGRTITLIAKQNEMQQWIILSCWANPPFAGSIDVGKEDNWRKYQKAGFWGKLWLTFLKQLGLIKW